MFENFNAFVQNPMMFMMKSKFNVPNNINTPNEIIDYLMRSGQLTQEQYNQVNMKFQQLQQSGKLPQQPT